MNASWKKSLRLQGPLLILSAVFSAAVISEAFFCDVPFREAQLFMRYMAMFLLGLLFFLFGLGGGAYFSHLKKTGFSDVSSRARESLTVFFCSDYCAYAVPAAAVLTMNSLFLVAKSLIVSINPFPKMKWDFYFSAWDKALHFGHYPYEAIITFVNALHMGRFLDVSYFFWLNVTLFVTVFNLFFDTKIHRRLRFLYVSLLSWILLGSIAATVFSSAGPMFYHRIYPAVPDIYGPINENIAALRKGDILFTAVTRAWLWKWQTNDTKLDPNAISAMPSMHVAIAWLIVLYAFNIGKCVALIATLFFCIVFLGSIYLGFHYAIDGYVSIIAVSIGWWGVGKILDRHVSRTDEIGRLIA